MPSLNLLIKPASGLCNLKCEYCFYHDIAKKRQISDYGMMSIDTLECIIKNALNYAENECTIAYQGGEPTLVGLDFFRKSIEFQNMYNNKKIRIHNTIQTNAYNIDHEWAKFFSDNNFLVGVSLDGTSKTHDAFRVDINGKDTFSKVIKNIKIMQDNKVNFNILTVVNAFTAKNIREIYNYYKSKKFTYLQFIPCLDPLGETFGQHKYSLTPKAYGEFLCKLFDLWYEDIINGNEVHIRQFDNYVEMLMGYLPESCGMSGVCSFQNVVEADGEVYPCDFYVIDKYKLGKLTECDFEEIQKNRKNTKFIEESLQMDEKCKSCEYLYICRGGCKRYREPKLNNKFQLNYFCKSYQIFFSYSKNRLIYLAKLYSSN